MFIGHHDVSFDTRQHCQGVVPRDVACREWLGPERTAPRKASLIGVPRRKINPEVISDFDRPSETEFGRDSTDCAQISLLLNFFAED
jgi:hypothetical protein